MKNNTQGWYTFEDGTRTWFHGLNIHELKLEVYKHGKVVKFEPTK